MALAALAAFIALALFGSLLFLQELGWRWGRRSPVEAAGPEGVGAVDAAVFGLLGLLMAFSFSGAATRFENRRALVVEEANAVGTAYLRLDLLPDEARDSLRERFRRYLDARLAGYQRMPDLEAARNEFDRAATIQGEIWPEAIAAAKAAGAPASMLLPPALNEMFDVASTRTAAMRAHLPTFIFGVLVCRAFVR